MSDLRRKIIAELEAVEGYRGFAHERQADRILALPEFTRSPSPTIAGLRETIEREIDQEMDRLGESARLCSTDTRMRSYYAGSVFALNDLKKKIAALSSSPPMSENG